MDKIWSKTELAHLKRQANTQSMDELAQRFHTDVPTVRSKIEELGLDSEANTAGQVDASIELFAQASEHLQNKRWPQANELFAKIVAESDSRQIVDRARQFLRICEQATAEPMDAGDPYLAAVYQKNEGNLDEALEICLAQGAVDSEEKYAYLAASIQALQGDEEACVASLSKAIDLEAKNRVHAFHDPDFDAVRSHQSFSDLVQVTVVPAPEENPEAVAGMDGVSEGLSDGFEGLSDAILAPADA